MSVATSLNRALLTARGRRRRWLGKARDWLIAKGGDPAVDMDVHGRLMSLPLSHELPFLLRDLPQYDQLPARLASFTRERDGRLVAIDVGANVGDTVAAMLARPDDRFLAIEPAAEFLPYLRANWGSNAQVTILDVACGAAEQTTPMHVESHGGTASIEARADGVPMHVTTVDALLRAHAEFAAANVLKIDTDGSDFDVIEGASGLLAARRPVLLFECADFGAPDYAARCRAAFARLRACGYRHVVVYDNVGYLMGCFPVEPMWEFEQLLFYQLSSPFKYFDVAAMPDDALGAFLEREREYFVAVTVPESLAGMARQIAPQFGAAR